MNIFWNIFEYIQNEFDHVLENVLLSLRTEWDSSDVFTTLSNLHDGPYCKLSKQPNAQYCWI